MRVINVSYDGGSESVLCDKERMHVTPKYKEKFIIRADKTVPEDYLMEVELDDSSFLRPGKDAVRDKNNHNIIRGSGNPRQFTLLDECHARGIAKFSIRLLNKAGDEIDCLDPHVVND